MCQPEQRVKQTAYGIVALQYSPAAVWYCFKDIVQDLLYYVRDSRANSIFVLVHLTGVKGLCTPTKLSIFETFFVNLQPQRLEEKMC